MRPNSITWKASSKARSRYSRAATVRTRSHSEQTIPLHRFFGAMKLPALKRLFMPAMQAAVAQFREFRRKRNARVTLGDLSQHMLEDVGQGHYRERNELGQEQLGRPADHFRS